MGLGQLGPGRGRERVGSAAAPAPAPARPDPTGRGVANEIRGPRRVHRRPVVRARRLRALPAAAAIGAELFPRSPAIRRSRRVRRGLADGKRARGVSLRARGRASERQTVLQVVDAFLDFFEPRALHELAVEIVRMRRQRGGAQGAPRQRELLERSHPPVRHSLFHRRPERVRLPILALEERRGDAVDIRVPSAPDSEPGPRARRWLDAGALREGSSPG
mmetsp:Transcript_3183/g.12558  ORF Transcript_3183/g.12558 Transcript_3183/m.12558 type:complete len:219 (-) Transcript_3183:655-1311(-)